MARLHRAICGIFLSALVAAPFPGRAQKAPSPPPSATPDPAVFAEATRLFADTCLQRFPDEEAVAKIVEARGGEAISPERRKRYLHDDPGRGWYLRTPLGLYVVTLEAPPFHACSVRRMTPSGIGGAQPFVTEVQDFATRHHLKAVRGKVQKRATPQGLDLALYPVSAFDASGVLADNLMIILSDYHGRPPAEFRTDAGTGTGVEVRLVRQDHPPTQPVAAPSAPSSTTS